MMAGIPHDGTVVSEATSWYRNDLMVRPAAVALGAKPCIQDKAMRSPDEAGVAAIPWTADYPMDARGEPPSTPELHDAIEARAPHAACGPSLPAGGPTAPMVEAIGPIPAAAATHSQVIVRPDLYKRYAAQRRAAAVPV